MPCLYYEQLYYITKNFCHIFQASESKSRTRNPTLHVDSLLQTAATKQKTENCAFIGYLVNTPVFVSRYGILYKGHRDSGRLDQVPNNIKGMDTS